MKKSVLVGATVAASLTLSMWITMGAVSLRSLGPNSSIPTQSDIDASTAAEAVTRAAADVVLSARVGTNSANIVVLETNAVQASRITGNIAIGNLSNAIPGVTRTYTNMVWNNGATTGNVVFVNGLLQ